MLARIDDVLAHNPDHCVVQGGGNDIGTHDRTASAIQADLSDIFDALEAAGVGIVATTICPSDYIASSVSGSASREATYDTVNAWVRANYSSWTGAVLCDWQPDITDATDGYIWKTGYDTDGVHPSATGKQAMADVLAPVLDAL